MLLNGNSLYEHVGPLKLIAVILRWYLNWYMNQFLAWTIFIVHSNIYLQNTEIRFQVSIKRFHRFRFQSSVDLFCSGIISIINVPHLKWNIKENQFSASLPSIHTHVMSIKKCISRHIQFKSAVNCISKPNVDRFTVRVPI